jgi:hypothetical protein
VDERPERDEVAHAIKFGYKFCLSYNAGWEGAPVEIYFLGTSDDALELYL